MWIGSFHDDIARNALPVYAYLSGSPPLPPPPLRPSPGATDSAVA